MKAYIAIILGILLLAVVGCTPEQEARAREMVKENRCSAFNGYLCSAPDDCAVPYLDVIESYCCPIKCGTCNQTCEDDGDPCTQDICSKKTDYKCTHEPVQNNCLNKTSTCKDGTFISCNDNNICTSDNCEGWGGQEMIEGLEFSCSNRPIKPCQNDGYCDDNEADCLDLNQGMPTEYSSIEIPSTGELICGGSSVSAGSAGVGECNFPNKNPGEINTDCPSTCDDGDITTYDRYDAENQTCEHIPKCDDGDSSTNDWFNSHTANCAHCKICVGPECP
ncbi:MAG: hypothetical protein KJ955_08090 [Nanoarchaeota archaeon]|nr:hypothetical protein [Nanoarchaeota archaeon]